MKNQISTRGSFLNLARHFNKRVTNPLMKTFAGKRIYALVYHVGRKSGRAYSTPVVAMPTENGFVLPLPYDDKVDWCQNILAAGGCRLQWHHQNYDLCGPRLIEPAEALPHFPKWLHPLLGHTHIYLRLSHSGGRKKDV